MTLGIPHVPAGPVGCHLQEGVGGKLLVGERRQFLGQGGHVVASAGVVLQPGVAVSVVHDVEVAHLVVMRGPEEETRNMKTDKTRNRNQVLQHCSSDTVIRHALPTLCMLLDPFLLSYKYTAQPEKVNVKLINVAGLNDIKMKRFVR